MGCVSSVQLMAEWRIELMIADLEIHRLEQLRQGDRFQYSGVSWTVRDCSTYSDAKGYQTTEWLIESTSGNEYYLLREVDPENLKQSVEWYLAEELKKARIYVPGSATIITGNLWSAIQEDREPYPELQANMKTFIFESKTEGKYRSLDSDRSRITWDYWDSEHHWNLALEAWEDGSLEIYLTQKVQPEEFDNLQRGVDFPEKSLSNSSLPSGQIIAALLCFGIGVLLMIFG
jgi:Domain of unknown function (DUF4178)